MSGLAVRSIYYEKIQSEAKGAIIGLPEPDNWDQIKANLKLQYKPDVELVEIYKRFSELRVSTV